MNWHVYAEEALAKSYLALWLFGAFIDLTANATVLSPEADNGA